VAINENRVNHDGTTSTTKSDGRLRLQSTGLGHQRGRSPRRRRRGAIDRVIRTNGERTKGRRSRLTVSGPVTATDGPRVQPIVPNPLAPTTSCKTTRRASDLLLMIRRANQAGCAQAERTPKPVVRASCVAGAVEPSIDDVIVSGDLNSAAFWTHTFEENLAPIFEGPHRYRKCVTVAA
jgi:hypothetical protein